MWRNALIVVLAVACCTLAAQKIRLWISPQYVDGEMEVFYVHDTVNNASCYVVRGTDAHRYGGPGVAISCIQGGSGK